METVVAVFLWILFAWACFTLYLYITVGKVGLVKDKWKAQAIEAEVALVKFTAERAAAEAKLKADREAMDKKAQAERNATEEKLRNERAVLEKRLKDIRESFDDRMKVLGRENTTLTTDNGKMLTSLQELNDMIGNKTAYESAIVALKNIFDGYGNDYIVPTHSLLDDLAEEFGFTEAGAELKNARLSTRNLIKHRRAASCDFLDDDKREAATDFITDAFNGKVDSILSRVKHDNVGILEQKIKDACSLVNQLGRGFANARINNQYLAARLVELKWAAITYELKHRAQEEQRAIREQMRDEERAKKEFEKAIKDAAKEEQAIERALDKMKAQMEAASGEQKLAFEGKLLELQERLKEAEEKNQRAKSMAEQTKSGNVYIISNEGSFGEGVLKIGLTRRLDPMDRVKELGDASVPFSFDVHAMIWSDNAPALEKSLHAHFIAGQMNKVNPRKEFFRVGVAHVREEIEKLGYKATWTLVGAAKDYRESKALEESFKKDPKEYDVWLSRQRKVMTERLWDISEADDDDDDDGEDGEVKATKKSRAKKSA
ncbi:MAG: DUF4041 domain-containing protein [Oligoflexus sp.]|nr:DUF4041 domain-containing protein [Oligoflexus sp.]